MDENPVEIKAKTCPSCGSNMHYCGPRCAGKMKPFLHVCSSVCSPPCPKVGKVEVPAGGHYKEGRATDWWCIWCDISVPE